MRLRASIRPLWFGAAVLVAMSVAVVDANPTSARPSVRYGKPDRFCLYENKDFGGAELCLSANELHLNLSSRNFDDKASSLVNNLPYEVCVYVSTDFRGNNAGLSGHSFWRNLAGNNDSGGIPLNNRISSVSNLTVC